jgi:serine/threonine protein kinase
LDAAVENAIWSLLQEGRYIGKVVVDTDSGNNEGLICVDETLPPTAQGLPSYIVELPSYTEKDCRIIFREIVSIIKLCHDNGMAHRNLLLTSLLVDRKVCSLVCAGCVVVCNCSLVAFLLLKPTFLIVIFRQS